MDTIDQLTFYIGDKVIEMGLGNVKYLLGDTFMKYDIFRTLKQTFDKTDNSEYATENNQSRRVLLNGERFPVNRFELVTVTELFDLKESLKVKTDSIFHHFYKALFKNIEYNDTFNTLSILFSDMEEELNTISESFQTEAFKPEITMKPLNAKSLLKWIDVSMTIHGKNTNPYDFSYEEIIAVQMKLIQEMAALDLKKDWIVYITLPRLTQRIEELMKHHEQRNIHYLVDTGPLKIDSIENVLWLGDPTIDFADEVAVYEELTMKKAELTTIEDTKTYYMKKFDLHGTGYTAKQKEFPK